MIELLKYPFMIKALVVGSVVGVSSALLGVFLVLRKQSMIGDGLAHVSFAAVALSLLLIGEPLILTLPLVILASLVIQRLSAKHVNSDAAIGLVSNFSIALGVILSSLNKGFGVDLFSYLFGSILVIANEEVVLSVALGLVTVFTVWIFYKDLFAITYDEEFCIASGMKTERLTYLLSVLTGVTVVLGIRIVGTMLISAMIVFPASSALNFSKSFKGLLVYSALINVLSVLIGVVGSFYFNLPTGASIVVVEAVFFVFSSLLGGKGND
ncbi:metal ABC transporter permease [Guggenheimella bovis]